jgi:hypothetical protein
LGEVEGDLTELYADWDERQAKSTTLVSLEYFISVAAFGEKTGDYIFLPHS